MQIIYPGSPHEFDVLFRETYANGQPTYFRLPQATHTIATHPKFGEAELLNEGNDISFIVIGPQLENAMRAMEVIKLYQKSVDVIYLTTLKPITDNVKKMIHTSVQKTKKVVTIEEHSVIGGLGDIVSGICSDIAYQHTRLGVQDEFLTNYGDYLDMCQKNLLTANSILREALR
jgi:transketolase